MFVNPWTVVSRPTCPLQVDKFSTGDDVTCPSSTRRHLELSGDILKLVPGRGLCSSG